VSGRQGVPQQEQQAGRFERYAALRDGGTIPGEAARQVGLANYERYERSYRERSGLPRRESRAPEQQVRSAGDRQWRLPL
jgi:hypothetical protein